nr:13719_t:CDS:2 [Entrophospora candida]
MTTTFSGNANEFRVGNRLSSGMLPLGHCSIEKEIKVALEEIPKDDNIDVIEIDLPPINDKKREKILETIHNIFQAERINDRLFIKFDGLMKERIHSELMISLRQQLPAWLVVTNGVSVVNGNEFRPDVGGWNQWPTRQQQMAPVINVSPPPLLWVEVAFNRTKDRVNALNKIEYVQPYCPNTEFVLIVIPFGMSPFQANPNPGIISVAVTLPRADRPSRAPYIGHWAVGVTFDAVQWYKMRWNEHIILGCGGSIYFNDVLTILS